MVKWQCFAQKHPWAGTEPQECDYPNCGCDIEPEPGGDLGNVFGPQSPEEIEQILEPPTPNRGGEHG
jgi:hypothetical protein